MNSTGTVLAGSYNGAGLSEQFTYTPSSSMWGYLKVYGYGGAYDASNLYVVWAGWTSSTEVAVQYSTSYTNYARAWYARPWPPSENATQLAAPQASDTRSIAVTVGVPWGYGSKDLCSHVDAKCATNSGYSTTKFYDYWWPESRRTVMYSPNVYFSSTKEDLNGASDAIRFVGETDSTRTGWVGIDCCGLYQRCLWLAGYRITTDSTREYGRIGNLDSKGTISMNTWGGEINVSSFEATSLAANVTDWVQCGLTSNIPFLAGMGPMRKGDMVIYKDSAGSICHMAVVVTPGTTQSNSIVQHAVWGHMYLDNTTGTYYPRRTVQSALQILSSGWFKIRRLTTIR